MKVAAVLLAFAALMRADFLVARFVEGKLANDSSIARDTRRIADAVEARRGP